MDEPLFDAAKRCNYKIENGAAVLRAESEKSSDAVLAVLPTEMECAVAALMLEVAKLKAGSVENA